MDGDRVTRLPLVALVLFVGFFVRDLKEHQDCLAAPCPGGTHPRYAGLTTMADRCLCAQKPVLTSRLPNAVATWMPTSLAAAAPVNTSGGAVGAR